VEFIAIALFFIALFGLITSKNIIKSIIFIMVQQTAVVMFWLQISAQDLPVPPIIYDPALLEEMEAIADPLPQALTLTAIIIGFSVITIIITMLNNLFRTHNTTDWQTIETLEGK